MEMNTRIQVEHPVTELITGIDLVKEQILVAMGEKISFTQAELVARGAAIECRLYAEDPASFLPTPGWVNDSWLPGGPFVRVETATMNRSKIPLDYDPMIAKICTWGRDRKVSIARMKRALSETLIAGSITNLAFLRATLSHPRFIGGNTTTKFIEEEKETLNLAPPKSILNEALGLALREEGRRQKTLPPQSAPWLERNLS